MPTGISDSNKTTTPPDTQPASSLNVRARWTAAVGAVVLPGLVLVAVSADGDPPNTGMADPVALMSAFDRSAGRRRKCPGPFALQPSGSVQRGVERRRHGQRRSHGRHSDIQGGTAAGGPDVRPLVQLTTGQHPATPPSPNPRMS